MVSPVRSFAKTGASIGPEGTVLAKLRRPGESLVISMRPVEALAFLSGASDEDRVDVFADLGQLGGAGRGWWVARSAASSARRARSCLGAFGQFSEAWLADGGIQGAGFEGGPVAVDGGLGLVGSLSTPASSRRRSVCGRLRWLVETR